MTQATTNTNDYATFQTMLVGAAETAYSESDAADFAYSTALIGIESTLASADLGAAAGFESDIALLESAYQTEIADAQLAYDKQAVVDEALGYTDRLWFEIDYHIIPADDGSEGSGLFVGEAVESALHSIATYDFWAPYNHQYLDLLAGYESTTRGLEETFQADVLTEDVAYLTTDIAESTAQAHAVSSNNNGANGELLGAEVGTVASLISNATTHATSDISTSTEAGNAEITVYSSTLSAERSAGEALASALIESSNAAINRAYSLAGNTLSAIVDSIANQSNSPAPAVDTTNFLSDGTEIERSNRYDETFFEKGIARLEFVWDVFVGFEQGTAQGGLNIVNGVQDSVIGLANLPATGINGMAVLHESVGILPEGSTRIPYIPSPDWSYGMITQEDPNLHEWSKFLGASGVETLTGTWLGRIRGAAVADDLVRKGSNEIADILRTKCFARDTLVSTIDGLCPIGKIAPGTMVSSFDFDEGVWRHREVTERIDSLFDGILVAIETDYEKIEATSHHPVWILRGQDLHLRQTPDRFDHRQDQGLSLQGRWVHSHELQEGDITIGKDGEEYEIKKVRHRPVVAFPVSNLTIGDYHNYAVGEKQLLVHNESICQEGEEWLRGLVEDGIITPKAAEQYLDGFDNAAEVLQRIKLLAGSADDVASFLGFAKTKLRSHGQAVYKDGRRYISRDVDGHSGGYWKMAHTAEGLRSKTTRVGTYDRFLNRIGD